MRRRILTVVALALPVAGVVTWQRARRVGREQALLAASVELTDALALAEGCLVGGGPRPARAGALDARLRRIALGDEASLPWPSRCAPRLDALARATRGLRAPPPSLRAVESAARSLRTAIARPDAAAEVAALREGTGSSVGRWLPALDALRTATERFARAQGRALRVPSTLHAPGQLPALAVETLPVTLGPGATLVGARAEAGVATVAWRDGDAGVVCRTADQGVSVRCRRGPAGPFGDVALVDGRAVAWRGRDVVLRVSGELLRVRDVDGRWRALGDDPAHGGAAVRAAWLLPVQGRALLVTAGDGVTMFWSDDGGRRWRATREAL